MEGTVERKHLGGGNDVGTKISVRELTHPVETEQKKEAAGATEKQQPETGGTCGLLGSYSKDSDQ